MCVTITVVTVYRYIATYLIHQSIRVALVACGGGNFSPIAHT